MKKKELRELLETTATILLMFSEFDNELINVADGSTVYVTDLVAKLHFAAEEL